jgi:hypothetical protein
MSHEMRNYLWPRIESREKAVTVMHHGAVAAGLSAGLTAALGFTALYLHRGILGIDGWSLLDTAFLAIVAWRVHRLSLVWAIFGLVLFTVEKLYSFAQPINHGGLYHVVVIMFFLYYLHAVRAGLPKTF